MKSNIKIRKFKNALFKTLIFTFAILSCVPLVLILYNIVQEGISSLNINFLLNLPKPVGETGGGISNALVGTLILIIISSVISIPLGVGIGVYLNENTKSKLSYYVRLSADILMGTPSVVIGMIGYLWVVKQLNTFSALSGGIALSIMMLPVIISSTEETLKLLPYSLKESSFALGIPYYATVLKVVLPAGLNGIITGVMLGVARIAGETAPLLFTAFGSPFMNFNILKPVSSLPQQVFIYATSPYKEWHALAWGAAFVLIAFVLTLNILAKTLSRRWKVQF